MSAKKITNYLVSINNINDIKELKKVGINTFLFPLKDYSIGYEKTYTIEEINNIKENKYVLINQVLNNKQIDDIKLIINKITCDGFIIEDIGLINVLKDLNKEIILFINHFNCNYKSINYWLEYVSSVIVSNELTYDEIKEITNKVNKKVILHVFGYNQVMYSKRKLLSNYYKYNKKDIIYKNTIEDKQGIVKYHVLEDNYGTIFYSDKIFDGRKLLQLDNVLYYYINSTFIDIKDIINFINNKDINNTDDGFLSKKTYYKLK